MPSSVEGRPVSGEPQLLGHRGLGEEQRSRDLGGRHYAVVGGGLSGLAAAWYLQGRGAEAHIFEAEGELGGRACSGELGGRTVTLGGKNIGRSYARFRAFSSSLGDHRYEHFGINSSRAIDGKMVTFDSGQPIGMLRNLRGISARDFARIADLVFLLKRDPSARYLSAESCQRLAERYGSTSSVQEIFGRRMREALLRTLTVRVSAAEPDEVPIMNVLPYLAMITDTYDQLTGGMQAVVSAAARRCRVSLGTRVDGLMLEDGGVCGVRITTPDGDQASETFDGVVIATHAHAAAELVETIAPVAASGLREVRYFPVVVLLVEYERPVFDSGLRALAFGPERALSNAGAYGTAGLNIVRYTFSGRRARALAEQQPDEERLATMAEAALLPYARVSGNSRRAMIAHRFSPGLCAYHPDQASFLERLGSAGAKMAGVRLTGDYLRGCSIEACFAASEQAVGAIEPSLQR